MPERSALTELCQIGLEGAGTPGAAVAATKRLQAMALEVNPDVETDSFRPKGYKFPTMVTPTKEWTHGSLEGRLTYDEFVYALAMLTGVPAPVVAATVATWTIPVATSALNTPRTATVENGSSVRAHRAAGTLLSGLGYTIDRDGGCTLSGDSIGLRLEDGIVLTAGAVEAAVTPVLIGQVSVFLDATSAALGTTKLLRLKSLEWELGDTQNPVWVIDAAQQSYAATVEGEPSATVTMTLEANAEGMALLPILRAGATRFCRVEAIGPNVLATATPHRFRHDMALKVEDVSDLGDDDGLRTVEWTFSTVHDAGWGKSQQFELVNGLTAL